MAPIGLMKLKRVPGPYGAHMFLTKHKQKTTACLSITYMKSNVLTIAMFRSSRRLVANKPNRTSEALRERWQAKPSSCASVCWELFGQQQWWWILYGYADRDLKSIPHHQLMLGVQEWSDKVHQEEDESEEVH